MTYGPHGSSLRDLPRLRTSRRRRASSWDRTGGNDDRVMVEAGQAVQMADIEGPGSIQHIWCTAAPRGDGGSVLPKEFLRSLVLRITWDGQQHPSVLAPLGDFFGVGHGESVNLVSAPLQRSPRGGRSLTSWFHMPFAQHARLELVSEWEHDPVAFYFYVDYELFDGVDDELGYFHAQWRRENPTTGRDQREESNLEFLSQGTNLDGADNYVVLDAEGRGHYVGCVLNLRNLRDTDEWNWYGEGDDMIFIDGDRFPPSLHGTGTEDYVDTAWCPAEVYNAPYHGMTLPGGSNWAGEVSMYRFHIEDPVTFETSIRVTLEHGHANKRSDDWSSMAYWYQTLPHRPFGLAPVHLRVG